MGSGRIGIFQSFQAQPALSKKEEEALVAKAAQETEHRAYLDDEADRVITEEGNPYYNEDTRQFMFSVGGLWDSRDVTIDCGGNDIRKDTGKNKKFISINGVEFKPGEMPKTTARWIEFCK